VVVAVDTRMMFQSSFMTKGLGKAKELAPMRCMHGATVCGEDGTLAMAAIGSLNRTQQSLLRSLRFI
jgi:hypothetical protein